VQFLRFFIIFISFSDRSYKNYDFLDGKYGQQVFQGTYGHFAVLGFAPTGHGQTFQYTDCPYHIRTGGNPALNKITKKPWENLKTF
jgi:hypothetical protein